MRLLVTRAEPDAMRTASRLSMLGHQVMVEPMLVIDFRPPPNLTAPAALIVTSRNGIRALQRWPEAVDWRDLPLFAVGKATASAAREAGFNDIRIADNDARSLTTLVFDTFTPDEGTLLYPAAFDRSADLELGLAERGYSIRLIESYRAHAVDRLSETLIERLRQRTIDGMLFFSQRTATTFGTLATTAGLIPALSGTAVYALSEQVAAPLRAVSPKAINVAEVPTEDALLALIPQAAPDRV